MGKYELSQNLGKLIRRDYDGEFTTSFIYKNYMITKITCWSTYNLLIIDITYKNGKKVKKNYDDFSSTDLTLFIYCIKWKIMKQQSS